MIADRAISAKNSPVAERALRQIFELENGNVEKFALAASLGQTLNPQLGAELWPLALKRAQPDKNNQMYGGGYQPSVGMWAFYHAALDPALSRVLIEREWNWRLPAAVKTKDAEYSQDKQLLGQLEMGMAAVDPARALEMREQDRAQVQKDGIIAADVDLAAALLASDVERARLGVDSRY